MPLPIMLQLGACPAAFTSSSLTIGAISNSQELALCVANSTLISGANGQVTLVLNSNASVAPRCLVYPNGLSPDLTYTLLASGHVGCWSLYPPSQPVVISNVGRPSIAKLQEALKKFKPTQPIIRYSPRSAIKLGTQIAFSSSSKTELVNCVLVNLPCQVRFRPVSYSWNISGDSAKLAKPSYLVTNSGELIVTLSVSFSVEYSFPRLTNWQLVRPNILSNANPVRITVGEVNSTVRKPRLVYRDCNSGPRWGC